MTNHDLSELLARSAGRVQPGPAPVASMELGASRMRRRRVLAGVGTAALVAAVVGGVVAFTPGSSPGKPGPVVASDPVPAGMRLVGVGNLAIAVPDSWGTNAINCGAPTRDTVIIDVGAISLCLPPYPRGVESVWIYENPSAFLVSSATEPVTIDGVRGRRIPTKCAPSNPATVIVCRGGVFFPAEKVLFEIASSTGSGQVDALRSRLRVVSDLVAVPAFSSYDDANQDDPGGAQAAYLERLKGLGFAPEVVTERRPGMKAGFVLGTTPAVGTMLKPGSKVTVTVIALPAGPVDELQVGVNSRSSTSDESKDLSDAQVRAGATISLKVGDEIWAYASGKREETLAGVLNGGSLADSTWPEDPNKGHSWKAVRTGTTSVTLTIIVDGTPVKLGTVKVVVS